MAAHALCTRKVGGSTPLSSSRRSCDPPNVTPPVVRAGTRKGVSPK